MFWFHITSIYLSIISHSLPSSYLVFILSASVLYLSVHLDLSNLVIRGFLMVFGFSLQNDGTFIIISFMKSFHWNVKLNFNPTESLMKSSIFFLEYETAQSTLCIESNSCFWVELRLIHEIRLGFSFHFRAIFLKFQVRRPDSVIHSNSLEILSLFPN